MRADELYERDLPSEIESSNQAIVASRHFEPDALTVENLGFRSRFLHLVRGGPSRSPYERVPTLKRDLCLGVFAPKSTRTRRAMTVMNPYSMFPIWEQGLCPRISLPAKQRSPFYTPASMQIAG